MATAEETRESGVVKVAGVCGKRKQAVAEAQLAVGLGYDVALLSLGKLKEESITELLEHSRCIASIIPVMGFYLRPAVGGRVLPYEFWRQFVEIENVVAIDNRNGTEYFFYFFSTFTTLSPGLRSISLLRGSMPAFAGRLSTMRVISVRSFSILCFCR